MFTNSDPWSQLPSSNYDMSETKKHIMQSYIPWKKTNFASVWWEYRV
jgi:hypothetical protein